MSAHWNLKEMRWFTLSWTVPLMPMVNIVASPMWTPLEFIFQAYFSCSPHLFNLQVHLFTISSNILSIIFSHNHHPSQLKWLTHLHLYVDWCLNIYIKESSSSHYPSAHKCSQEHHLESSFNINLQAKPPHCPLFLLFVKLFLCLFANKVKYIW